jgi:hypothetical protein
MPSGSPAAAPSPGAWGGGAGTTPEQMMMMMMMEMFMRPEREKNDLATVSGKAYRRMHILKNRVYSEPEVVIQQYIDEVRLRMGVEDGDVWQLWQYTEKLNWGRMTGMKRIHHHLHHCLALSLKGQRRQSEAYQAQLLRAVWQSALDGADWSTASLLLPGEDPISRVATAATETEMEAIVAYQEAQRKLKKKEAPRAGEEEDDEPGKGKGAWKRKPKDEKGKDK